MDNTGHWLNVRHGSYQAMKSQRNSRGIVKERRTTKQISGKGGCLFFNR